MLFRPNFCANCGEKIERPEWRLWTSRRFCELCATEFQLQEYTPRAIVGVAVLAIVSSIGGFFGAGTSRGELLTAKQQISERSRSQSVDTVATRANSVVTPVSTNQALSPSSQSTKGASEVPQARATQIEKTVSADPFFCGAMTKKGTACSRRVKGNARCFQHTGKPAMLTPRELKIS